MRLTPEQEAAYALDHGVTRAELKPHVQSAYDGLLEQPKAEGPRLGGPVASARWQGSPLPPPWHREWSVWLLVGGLCGVLLAFIVGGFGGSDGSDPANLAAAALFSFGLVAVCVATARLLYRWYRVRVAAQPRRAPLLPFSPCYGCGYPVAVHSGDDLTCPQAGICYRCGLPLTAHTGYELTCPGSKAPNCHRCGQPSAAHVGDGLTCPVPPAFVT